LLPALPKAWQTGQVKGLRARFGYEISIAWQQGKLTQADIKATHTGVCAIRYQNKVAKIETEAGKTYSLDASLSLM
jgi:alpha-L-fucosidase 2